MGQPPKENDTTSTLDHGKRIPSVAFRCIVRSKAMDFFLSVSQANYLKRVTYTYESDGQCLIGQETLYEKIISREDCSRVHDVNDWYQVDGESIKSGSQWFIVYGNARGAALYYMVRKKSDLDATGSKARFYGIYKKRNKNSHTC